MNHTLLFLGPSDGHEEEREREKSLSPHPPIAMCPPPLSRARSPPPPPPPPASPPPASPPIPATAQPERAARVEESERGGEWEGGRKRAGLHPAYFRREKDNVCGKRNKENNSDYHYRESLNGVCVCVRAHGTWQEEGFGDGELELWGGDAGDGYKCKATQGETVLGFAHLLTAISHIY